MGLPSRTKLPPLGGERRVKLQHGAGSRSGAQSRAWESKPNHRRSTSSDISVPSSSCNSAAHLTSDLAGYVGYAKEPGGATTLDNVPSRSAILNGLQRRGRA